MSLVSSYILPHPPIIVSNIGNGEEIKATKTVESVKEIADDIARIQPDTIIVITPHGPVFDDAVCISVEQKLSGSFKKFGFKSLEYEFDNNLELVTKLVASANLEDILVGEVNKQFAKRYNISVEIDHGTLVPLHFVNQKYNDYKLVHISMGLLPYHDLYRFGMSIKNVIQQINENIVVIASGDLSHRLLPQSPAGYNAKGKEFDEKLINLLKNHDVESIIKLDDNLVENAGECGLRPIIILQGIMDGYNVNFNILSYEGPFGVGYAVVKYDIMESITKSLYEDIVNNMHKRISEIRGKEDDYISLARITLENYVKNGTIIDVPKDLNSELLDDRAGVFVSIKKNGKLRGCIGTISPTRTCIAEEIMQNAISAGTNDNRFFPVDESELDELVYSVDVLKQPEPIQSKGQLNVYKYGVIVRKGRKSGLLLPNLDGIDTVDEQIRIALKKAGIDENDKYFMERFEVIRHDTK